MDIDWKTFNSFRNEIPVVDVRSPEEFQKGKLPDAVNIPLLNNYERVEVGKKYKQNGRYEAVRKALQLVGPKFENLVVEAKKISRNNKLLIYCWRGGMRSHAFRFFLDMAGIEVYILKGGYKTYKREALTCFSYPFRFILLSGYTGSGKSELLRMLKEKNQQVVDLETLANHKGSVFGGLAMPPQPTTEQFQNLLFEVLNTLDQTHYIWIEDESMAIGQVFLPNEFWKTMRRSPRIIIQLDSSMRIDRLVNEYGKTDKEKFSEAIEKITKKLGKNNAEQAKKKLLLNDMSGVIEILITCYYDKVYQHGLDKRNAIQSCVVEWSGCDPAHAVELLLTSAQRHIKQALAS